MWPIKTQFLNFIELFAAAAMCESCSVDADASAAAVIVVVIINTLIFLYKDFFHIFIFPLLVYSSFFLF